MSEESNKLQKLAVPSASDNVSGSKQRRKRKRKPRPEGWDPVAEAIQRERIRAEAMEEDGPNASYGDGSAERAVMTRSNLPSLKQQARTGNILNKSSFLDELRKGEQEDRDEQERKVQQELEDLRAFKQASEGGPVQQQVKPVEAVKLSRPEVNVVYKEPVSKVDKYLQQRHTVTLTTDVGQFNVSVIKTLITKQSITLLMPLTETFTFIPAAGTKLAVRTEGSGIDIDVVSFGLYVTDTELGLGILTLVIPPKEGDK